VKRFAIILLVNLFAAFALCVACVSLFFLMEIVRETTGWSPSVAAIVVVALAIIVWSAVRAWLETK
jgi:hypothetical protein